MRNRERIDTVNRHKEAIPANLGDNVAQRVKVQRTLVAEYEVPREHYHGMTDEQIIAFENGEVVTRLPEGVLENIKSEQVVVTFTGEDA